MNEFRLHQEVESREGSRGKVTGIARRFWRQFGWFDVVEVTWDYQSPITGRFVVGLFSPERLQNHIVRN